jgi:acetylornithine deacetylase/succinyl-diaminopimelate desuccinylase-like protein
MDGGWKQERGETDMRRLTLIVAVLASFQLMGAGAAANEGAGESLAGVREYRQAHAAEILEELVQWLRLPNVATNVVDIERNAEALQAMMEERGIRTEILPTAGGRPVVYGELSAAGADTTLLFYGHYDGQAVDPTEWHSAPFEPVLRRGYGGDWETISFPRRGEAVYDDWRIFARSASDDKSPMVALLAALDALRAHGAEPRVNLKFFFEGEEEQGSPYLEEILQREKERLRADLLIVVDGPVHQSGRPTLFFGARGIMTIELTVYGPTENLHSGHYGNWAPNPAMRLAQLLASMEDDEGRVTIAGFYDHVVPLTETEREALRQIPPVEAEVQERFGIGEPEGGGKSIAEMISLPSLNVDGLRSAWVGDEARTIIPRSATARLDVRMVKGNDHRRLFERILAHIQDQGWQVIDHEPTAEERRVHGRLIQVTKVDGYNAVRTPMDMPLAATLALVVERASSGTVVKLPTLGGSGPLHYFDAHGLASIGVPIVNFDNNQHGPDENLRLGDFFQGIDIFASILLWE